jgi:uncharacterized protein YjiS (DUF1127 family)
MTTLVDFFKRALRHRELNRVPDAVLRDIGLSRVSVEFP